MPRSAHFISHYSATSHSKVVDLQAPQTKRPRLYFKLMEAIWSCCERDPDALCIVESNEDMSSSFSITQSLSLNSGSCCRRWTLFSSGQCAEVSAWKSRWLFHIYIWWFLFSCKLPKALPTTLLVLVLLKKKIYLGLFYYYYFVVFFCWFF